MSRFSIIGLTIGLVALVVAVGADGAATASSTTVVLGSTATVPDPSCPDLPCQAVGSVTGFQVSTNQDRLPFIVPRSGKVKAWTLTLAQPTNRQRSFFNGFFGTPPEARLAILRRVPGHQPATLQPAPPGLDPRAQPLPRQDGQVRRQPESRKGRHRRPRRSPPGRPPSPRTSRRRTPGAPAASPAGAPTRPTSARASPRSRSVTAPDLRLPLQHRPPALHRDGGRGLSPRRLTPPRGALRGSPGLSVAPRRSRSGSGTRSAPGARSPRGSPRRSSRFPSPLPAGGGGELRRLRASP